MAKIPDWQIRAIRKVQWQAVLIWVVTFSVCLGLIYVLRETGDRRAEWGLAIGLPMIFVFVIIIPMAYRRGVRDGRDHQAD
jgi:hypothetical protein